jgi:uroporphyrinogen-III decarboxylase
MVSKTPDGTLAAVDAFDHGSQSWHPAEFPIKSREDIKAARHIFAHNQFQINQAQVPKCLERIAAVGDRGVVFTGMGISPLMNLIQHLIGPMNTHYFMADYPDEMDELISIMHEERMRFLRCLLQDCPYDYIVSVENTSTTLLSPRLFEKYCWRHLNDYGTLMRERGKSHVLHMCGHLKALLPRINELPAIAIEAYTSPTVGNTTLADRARLCPRIAVIGGTNAALWLRPVEEICDEIIKSIRAAGTTRGLVLTSAGVMPPAASIEKIRRVREFARGISTAN